MRPLDGASDNLGNPARSLVSLFLEQATRVTSRVVSEVVTLALNAVLELLTTDPDQQDLSIMRTTDSEPAW